MGRKWGIFNTLKNKDFKKKLIKMGKGLNRHVSKGDIQLANKYIKDAQHHNHQVNMNENHLTLIRDIYIDS